MRDPVFVDTSDGKALVADSLKPIKQQTDKKINDEVNENKSQSEQVEEEVVDKSEKTKDVDVTTNNVANHRGGVYIGFSKQFSFLI